MRDLDSLDSIAHGMSELALAYAGVAATTRKALHDIVASIAELEDRLSLLESKSEDDKAK
jgi:BMFP domain-containing protein YqiC